MMMPERVSVAFVQEQMKEYYHYLIENDPEAVEFDETLITTELINEMNKDIEGDGDRESVESATSYVPKSIWQVLADEEIVDEDDEDKFVEWFELANS